MLLGELDYANDTDGEMPLRINISERIKHPFYIGNSKYHDIALLKLEKAVEFSDFIRPICLPESNSIDFNIIATGWGKTEKQELSSHLQKVELDLYTHRECDDLYTDLSLSSIQRGILNGMQVCAGAKIGRRDTCQVCLQINSSCFEF